MRLFMPFPVAYLGIRLGQKAHFDNQVRYKTEELHILFVIGQRQVELQGRSIARFSRQLEGFPRASTCFCSWVKVCQLWRPGIREKIS